MIETFAVATGGAFGSGARYWVALWLVPWSRTLPLGTIGINIVGSVAISFFGTLTLAIAVPGIARYFSATLGGEQGLRVASPEPPAWFLDALFFLTGSEPTNSQYYAIVGWTLLVLVFFVLANLIRGRVGRRPRARHRRSHARSAPRAGRPRAARRR